MSQSNPIYILSARSRHLHPAQGCVNEFEDVLAETLNARIVSPMGPSDDAEFVRRAGASADLFVVALTMSHLVETLRRARGWRTRFNRVWGYVFDSALPAAELHRSALRRRVSGFSRTVASLDHLFLSCRPAVGMAADCYPIPVSYVPLAADVKRFGSMQPLRAITVNAYGRQHPDHLARLANTYNHNGSNRCLYYTSHLSEITVHDMVGHRALFWKMLSMSCIALAYDIMRVKGGRDMPFSFVGQRWFESLAAGCVVVGYRPDCVEADELLNWQDATIDCPEDTEQFMALIDDLLCDQARLDAARVSNYRNMAAAHDWSHRVAAMIDILNLARPNALQQRLSDLKRLAQPAAPEVVAA
ncbi:MAG TPA: glycosyltransferase [Albitalea sp.]|nr:glycosyltransferase [Albitalea sp.]